MEKMDALEKEREEATEVKKKFTTENMKLLKQVSQLQVEKEGLK
jgi:hypothetical protein